jgi:hypothetical protein
MHLAQLNVGRLVGPEDDPRVADFMEGLDRINALAEASPGFVWRLQDEGGNATAIKVSDDPQFIVNLSVWASVEALADFAYRSDHTAFLRRRREFFEVPTAPILCLWWVPEGEIPTVEDALERIEHLRAHGPSPTSFTFRHRYDPGGQPVTKATDRDTCPA